MYKYYNCEWKNDKEYMEYIESGESAAVFIVKDIVVSIDTNGKWIDVISHSTYHKRGAGDRLAFNWIIIELFPRKINPRYDKQDSAHNKYLTWITAHEDIARQRKSGFHGEKFLVLCNLINKNKNKFIIREILAKKYWEPIEAYHPVEVKEPVDPDWEYRISAVKKVNSRQVSYIINNQKNIEDKIRKNKKATLEMFYLQKSSH